MNDESMSGTIREVLLNSFLTVRPDKDTQYLAAQMIAVNLLKDGFKELERIARIEEKPEKRLSQPGL